ncbi:MAG: hypothetical protein LAT64_01290 [Phycisphaerales bacterium]|nr:hypothetical protein [Planctomycetota bacterium]MCH8507397.1 hypothetical protein [Phycisphaerales bacterium]
MGVIGTDILDNDFAADAYAEFLGLMEEGVSPRGAVRRMVKDACLDGDPYEVCPFWLGLALAQVESGRLTRRVRRMALRIIDSGMDLAIWEAESPGDVADRGAALVGLRERIMGPKISPKRQSRPPKDRLDWEPGDVFAYRLRSGRWTAFRLDAIEGQRTREGTFELYDLSVSDIPTPDQIAVAEFRLSAFAKSEISSIHQRSIEALGLFGAKLERIQNATEEEYRNTIVPELIQEATISGARISLLLRDFNAVGPQRLERIARGVNRTPPGWFSYHCYADDLDTVLEREFGLA